VPLRLLGLFRAHCPLCGGPLGRYWKLVSSVKPKEIGFLSPGSPTALLSSGGTEMPGPVLLRFRCLIGRAPHRTIVAMIYTESKYKHNSSPPPHDLRLPPLSPMSCTSLPRRAPPPSLILHGRSRQSPRRTLCGGRRQWAWPVVRAEGAQAWSGRSGGFRSSRGRASHWAASGSQSSRTT